MRVCPARLRKCPAAAPAVVVLASAAVGDGGGARGSTSVVLTRVCIDVLVLAGVIYLVVKELRPRATSL